jgi:hypothetical protein
MAIAFVQSKAASSGGTSVSSQSVTFTGANVAGNLLVAFVEGGGTGITNITIADSLSNTWVPVNNFFHDGGSGFGVRMFYVSSCASGSNTVTGTLVGAASAFTVIAVHEYSGFTNAVLDQTATSAGASATTVSIGPTGTTATANEAVVAMWMAGGSSTAAGTGYTLRENSNMSGGGTEYQIVSATGAYTATATTTGSWVGSVATFMSAAVASTSHFLGLLGVGS